jgi:excisionase family DNA binding protein
MATATRPPALRPKGIANKLDCSLKVVYALIASRQLRAIRVGTEYRILAADFDAFLREQSTA